MGEGEEGWSEVAYHVGELALSGRETHADFWTEK